VNKPKTFQELATRARDVWSSQLPTMENNSTMMDQLHRQEIETLCLQALKRMNILILSLMRRKSFANFLRKDLYNSQSQNVLNKLEE